MMWFDKLKLSKQLAEVGMDSRQAELLAQSFADILARNNWAHNILDGQFATKQDLKNGFVAQNKEMDSHFATKEDLKAGFAAFSELMEARFAETEQRLHRQLMQSQMVLLAIMLAALGLATILILMK